MEQLTPINQPQPQPQPEAKTPEEMLAEFRTLIASLVAQLNEAPEVPKTLKIALRPLVKMMLSELTAEKMPELIEQALDFLGAAYIKLEDIGGRSLPVDVAQPVDAAPRVLELSGGHQIAAVSFVDEE